MHPSAVTARLLGVPTGASLRIADGAAVGLDQALAETVCTGRPLMLTYEQKRPSDGAHRSFVTAALLERDQSGTPARIRGHLLDITDSVHGGAGLLDGSVIKVAGCGPAVVLVLAGELDLSNHAVLAGALHEAVARSDGDVHVDVRHVRFCGARAVSILAGVVDQLLRGRKLVLVHPIPMMRRILALTLLDGTTGDVPIELRGGPAH